MASHIPQTTAQAVSQLLDDLAPEVLETVKSSAHDDLIDFHLGIGGHVRCQFELWNPTSALLRQSGTDDASLRIIEELWRYLQAT